MTTTAMEVEGSEASTGARGEQAQISAGPTTNPYRTFLEDTIFPRCHLVATPEKGHETYTRSLSMLGHGVPLWDPIGTLSRRRKKKHLATGISIGDVGYLGRRGEFIYLFNVFSSATDDIQVNCPPELDPLSPLDSQSILKNETYFVPGTTFISKGVTECRLATSPLDIKFTVNARESGILILPDGASREDLVATDILRKYVQENALAWYRFVNKYSESTCSNGNLYVITGCDKACTFAAATSSPESSRSVRFQDGKWKDGHDMFTTSSYGIEDGHTCTVFIRGMQVALSASNWIRDIFQDEPPARLSFYYMLAVPVTGPQAKWQSWKEKYLKYTEKRCNGDARVVTFHPLAVVLRFLVQEAPMADVAIAEDSQWCPFVKNSDGSISHIVRILQKTLEEHQVSEKDGLVTLVPYRRSVQGSSPSSSRNLLFHALDLIQAEYQARLCRSLIAGKLGKLLPGQGLPDDMLL